MPYYGPYGPVWGAPPMAPPPQVQYNYQGNQAISASQGQPKPSAPSKKSAPSDSKKRKVAEVASGSQPKAGSAKAVSLPIKVGKLSPQEQAVQLRAAKRTESFARLTRKAHLYQSAMDRFRRSLVYHNRRFGESIHEGEMVDLIDKSEEAELDDSLKKKQKNRDRLSKRKAKSLANKVSKLAAEPEEIPVQAPARELASSAVVSSTPESLDTDVEMTPAVALPVGDLREGQIYHLVDGKLVVYEPAHLSTAQPSPNPPPEVLIASEQPISYAEVVGKESVTKPASTGLEDKLAKLSTSSNETSQSRGASGPTGTRGKLATGTPRVIPGLALDPPKATPAEKRKRKRLAAKAAKAAKVIQAAKAPNTTEGAKIVLTIKGPPQNTGAISKKSSTVGRQKTSEAGQGSSREGKGPEGR